MLELLQSCPVCDGEKFSKLECNFTTPIPQECTNCGLVLDRLPSDPFSFYTRANYDQRRKEVYGNPTAWSRWRHDYVVATRRLSQLKKCIPEPPCDWIDFGCGNGAILSAARAAGHKVLGVELDPTFCDEVSGLLGHRVYSSRDFFTCKVEPPPTTSRILSLFDSLEHLHDPVGILRQAVGTYKVSHVVIEVPDLSKHVGSISNWCHFKKDEHVTYWTPKTLDSLRSLKLNDFECIHQAEPVPGRLQVVWRRYVRSTPQSGFDYETEERLLFEHQLFKDKVLTVLDEVHSGPEIPIDQSPGEDFHNYLDRNLVKKSIP